MMFLASLGFPRSMSRQPAETYISEGLRVLLRGKGARFAAHAVKADLLDLYFYELDTVAIATSGRRRVRLIAAPSTRRPRGFQGVAGGVMRAPLLP